jgi:Spy/CpxP family protein refolding chaperone
VNERVAARPDLQDDELQCTAITAIDSSALESLEAVVERLHAASITLHLSEVKGLSWTAHRQPSCSAGLPARGSLPPQRGAHARAGSAVSEPINSHGPPSESRETKFRSQFLSVAPGTFPATHPAVPARSPRSGPAQVPSERVGQQLTRINAAHSLRSTMHSSSSATEGAIMRTRLSLTLVALGLAATSVAGAQGYGPHMGSGYGSGMMNGSGPGMMRGGGPGGPGGALAALDLKDEQREKIFAIQEEAHSKNWGTMGQLRSEQFKLRRLYDSDKVDAKAAAEQQKKVDELRRQLQQSRIETHNQVLAILTPEQRKQVRQFGPWWGREEE